MTETTRQPDAAESPRLHRLLSLIPAALAALLPFLLALRQITNYDIWWHLRVGQWIVDNGAVPRADPFSHTAAGAAWVPHYWLSDVIFYAVQRATSLEGLVIFKALVVAAAFLLVHQLMVRARVDPVLACGATMLAAGAASFRFLMRPHVFMFLLAALALWLLSREPERGRRVFWLVPLTALWANLHGSFFLGPLLVGFWLLEVAAVELFKRVRGQGGDLRRLGRPALLLALTSLATLATPLGLGLLRWVVGLFVGTSLTHALKLEEHRTLSWGEHPLFWAVMLATALSFILAHRRARLLHVLVFGATTLLALRGGRYAALAALLQAPILGLNLLAFFREDLAHRLTPATLSRLGGVRWIGGLAALLAGAVLLFHDTYDPLKFTHLFGPGVAETHYPLEAAAFLRRVQPPGRLYNSYELGGIVLWHLPGKRTFLDGRNLDDQLRFQTRFSAMAPPVLDAFLKERGVRAALVSYKDRPIARFFRALERFDLVCFDDQALVYLERAALGRRAAAAEPFTLLRPEETDVSYLLTYARSPAAPRAEAELRRAVRLAPRSARAHYYLGRFLEASGRRREALRAYLAAARANPYLAYLYFRVGIGGGELAMALGDRAAARELATGALRFHPGDPRLRRLLDLAGA